MMQGSKLIVRVSLAAAAIVGWVGCGDDEDNAHDPDSGYTQDSGAKDGGSGTDGGKDGGGDRTVTIAFEPVVGDEAFLCTETYAVGKGGTQIMPLDAKFYVHGVALLAKDGEVALQLEQDGAFQNGDVALLDFEDDTGSCSNGTKPTHTAITGTVPQGEYTGLRFTIGVPEARNHVNQATAPSPLNIEGMFWSWTTGYKFLRIDVATMMMHDDAGMADEDAGIGHQGAAGGFNVHLGSTMCAGDATKGDEVTCTLGNRPEVKLSAFDPDTQKIVVDIAELLADSQIAHDGGGAPGCMSGGTDPECPALFGKLGLDLATGKSIGNPKFLRVVNK